MGLNQREGAKSSNNCINAPQHGKRCKKAGAVAGILSYLDVICYKSARRLSSGFDVAKLATTGMARLLGCAGIVKACS